MPADDGFVTAVGPDGKKRRVPKHYLENPKFSKDFKLPPSHRRVRATPATIRVTEPAQPENPQEEKP
ncbi:hypothetical protein [Arthrobacter sp. VKM Ac-2550]|uniref:hypothetical protein n=1 Tax=Crystallibacter permensis TaxID=1938888 RepID=UPI00222751A4|nr:hypothetical protein [Arthrobacter sp. VKM Ac-2550]MCW2132886.1 hypothetical protein [Arthrobacter sp. VKM Ac-2550]